MDDLRYNWESKPPEHGLQKTPAGNYIDDTIYRTRIGNYIALSLYQTDGGRKYGLFLSIMVWKEDGCKEDKTCQAQRVASFSTKFPPYAALVLAENWFQVSCMTRSVFPAWGLQNFYKLCRGENI